MAATPFIQEANDVLSGQADAAFVRADWLATGQDGVDPSQFKVLSAVSLYIWGVCCAHHPARETCVWQVSCLAGLLLRGRAALQQRWIDTACRAIVWHAAWPLGQYADRQGCLTGVGIN